MAKKHGHHLHGNMSLLGLGDFGAGWNELWGVAIGGGISGVTSISLGHMGDSQRAADRHFYGLTVGLLASALMYAKQSTRHLAVPSALGSALVSGLPWLEQKLLGTVQAPAKAAAPAAGEGVKGRLGMTRVHRLGPGMNGLGYTVPQRLNGLGITALAPAEKVYGGAVGVANPAGMSGPTFAGTQVGATRPPVSLLGAATTQSKQVQLLGGPAIHGLSTQYGATLLGGGR